MKPKASPTSPKVNKKHQAELSKLYTESLKTIEKPKKTSSVGLLLLVMFLGFLSGIVGMLFLISYGSELPFLDKFEILSYSGNTSLIISGHKSSDTITEKQREEIVGQVGASIVQIFIAKKQSAELSASYLPSESLGNGFVLTNDGYIVTSKQVLGSFDNKYIVMTAAKDIYEVLEIIEDPITDFIFLRTEAENLTTFDFADSSEIKSGEVVLMFKQRLVGNTPMIYQASVLEPRYKSDEVFGEIVNSSESYNSVIWLGDKIPAIFHGAIVFTVDKKVLGIVEKKEDDYYVLPMQYIEPVLDMLWDGESLKRIYLGIHYVNLTEVVNLSDELSQGLSKGILVYTNDETELPSVVAGSPAESSGLIANDIITHVNSELLNGHLDFSQIIQNFDPGELITLRVKRQGENVDIKVTLDQIE